MGSLSESLLFIYTFPLALCCCSSHEEGGIVTTGVQILYKHIANSYQILVLDPEEHYCHPRSLSKCRFLFPRLTLCVIQKARQNPRICIYLFVFMELAHFFSL